MTFYLKISDSDLRFDSNYDPCNVFEKEEAVKIQIKIEMDFTHIQ